MTIQSWAIYLTLVTVATSTPGSAVLFIMTNATLYGWKKAVFVALGNVTGLFCLGIVAITGLGAILKTSQFIFDCVKFSGAAYLLYLGIKIILQKSPNLTIAEESPESGTIQSHQEISLFF
jgi:threonine/homoserine/homoserine lactone efflux protein